MQCVIMSVVFVGRKVRRKATQLGRLRDQQDFRRPDVCRLLIMVNRAIRSLDTLDKRTTERLAKKNLRQ